MPAFNFFETILLISLAITFVLILFLVYHFKQRIATTEEKTDTMFDIINNMAQEMTNIRTAMNMVTQAPNAIHTPVTHVPSFNKIDVSDEDNESEYETESESGSDEDDAESGSDSESESEDGSDSEGESEDNVNAEDDSEEIKHISMDLDNEIDNQIESNDVNSDNDIDEKEEAPVEINSTDLVVEKLDEVIKNVEENDVDNESLDSRVTYSHSGYRKMNLANLRQLAITRGLTTDTSKMKKNDIISLLENNE